MLTSILRGGGGVWGALTHPSPPKPLQTIKMLQLLLPLPHNTHLANPLQNYFPYLFRLVTPPLHFLNAIIHCSLNTSSSASSSYPILESCPVVELAGPLHHLLPSFLSSLLHAQGPTPPQSAHELWQGLDLVEPLGGAGVGLVGECPPFTITRPPVVGGAEESLVISDCK